MLPSRIPTASVVKETVKQSLRGNWLSAIAVGLMPVFVYYALTLLLSAVVSVTNQTIGGIATLLFVLAVVFLLLPLFYGVLGWFWRLTDAEAEDICSAFYYFSSGRMYIRALKLSVTIIFKIGVVLILCMLPYFAVQTFSSLWHYDIFETSMPVAAINITAFKSLFRNFGIVLAIFFSLRYYMTPIIAVMDDNLLILEAVHISSTVSKKSISALFGLLCSNILWMALSVLVLPLLYTAPFLIGCYVVHSRFAMVNYNLNLEFYQKNRFNSYYKV